MTTGRPGCITCANFTPGEGESQWSYSDGCSDSDVVTLPWPLISLLGFISNQFVMNIIRWHWHEIRDVLHLLHGWVLHEEVFSLFRKTWAYLWSTWYWSFLCSQTGCCSWQLKLGWALLAWRHGLLDHQDDKLVKPQFDVNPTEESGSWISRYTLSRDWIASLQRATDLCAVYLWSHLKTCSMRMIMIRRLKCAWRKCDTLWHSRRIISITSVSSDTFDTTCTILCHKYYIQQGCTPEKSVHT